MPEAMPGRHNRWRLVPGVGRRAVGRAHERPPADLWEDIMGRRFARNLVAVAATLGAMVAALAAATGGDWPAKPVRVIVAYAAGGANDLLGRVFCEQLSAALGQQFFVENRTGGGGLVGTEAAARAEPDGYTLIVSGMPSHVLAPAMNRNAGFDPVRDFTHIAYLGGPPNVFAVHNSSPVKTLDR